MKKASYYYLFGLLILNINLLAQKHTISGYVSDKETGERLIGASIQIKGKNIGVATNYYGFYSLTIESDSIDLISSFVGYQPDIKSFTLLDDKIINFSLSTNSNLEEIQVTAKRIENIVEKTQMSSISIPIQQIKKLPALLGEVDVLKALQLMPGIQSGNEGTSGLYVRGGGPDQNLILLDGTPVYNASHLFGFFSVFNADAINNIELIKGGFPARFGGRLSSVLNISMKEGNLYKYNVEGTIGLVSSKAMIEGPIQKGKSSFIISARRTYFDQLFQPIFRASLDEGGRSRTGYYFYDVNAKLNFKLSEKDHLYVSAYTGKDKFYLKLKPDKFLYDGVLYEEERENFLGWGNLTSALRWNHQFSSKFFMNLAGTFTQYNFSTRDYQNSVLQNDTGVIVNKFLSEYLSGINDWGIKLDFDFIPNPQHYIRFGLNGIYHTFKPGVNNVVLQDDDVNTNLDSTFGASHTYASELSAFVEDDFQISSLLKANLGVHSSSFIVNGRVYNSVQPRLAIRYKLNEQLSLKTSYAFMQQYIHLLTNSNIGLPTDLWVPATDKVLPQKSHQIALGIAKTLNNGFEVSIEGYYKPMQNLIEYKEGVSFLNNSENWEDKIEIGNGLSYGMEFLVQKKVGNTTGWLGYTLSWTNRQFKNLNFGETFPYKYDRRHDISIVVSHKLSKKWDFSGTWVFGTGNALSLPTVQYRQAYSIGTLNSFFGSQVEYFPERNNFRAASFHRLNVSFTKHKIRKWADTEFSVGLYNVYNRRNPFYYYIGYDYNSISFNGVKALKRVSLMPVIPAVSWKFKLKKNI